MHVNMNTRWTWNGQLVVAVWPSQSDKAYDLVHEHNYLRVAVQDKL